MSSLSFPVNFTISCFSGFNLGKLRILYEFSNFARYRIFVLMKVFYFFLYLLQKVWVFLSL